MSRGGHAPVNSEVVKIVQLMRSDEPDAITQLQVLPTSIVPLPRWPSGTLSGTRLAPVVVVVVVAVVPWWWRWRWWRWCGGGGVWWWWWPRRPHIHLIEDMRPSLAITSHLSPLTSHLPPLTFHLPSPLSLHPLVPPPQALLTEAMTRPNATMGSMGGPASNQQKIRAPNRWVPPPKVRWSVGRLVGRSVGRSFSCWSVSRWSVGRSVLPDQPSNPRLAGTFEAHSADQRGREAAAVTVAGAVTVAAAAAVAALAVASQHNARAEGQGHGHARWYRHARECQAAAVVDLTD